MSAGWSLAIPKAVGITAVQEPLFSNRHPSSRCAVSRTYQDEWRLAVPEWFKGDAAYNGSGPAAKASHASDRRRSP